MQGGKVLDAIVKEFSDIGYTVSYKVLNAVDYGLPQARPRFILIGRSDSRTPTFPNPTHGIKSENQDFLFKDHILKPSLNCWDALSDLPKIKQGQGAEELVHSGDYFNSYQRDRRGYRNPGIIFNHRATRHSNLITERYAAIPEGGDNSQVPERLKTKKINVFKLDRDKPARTITCNFRTDILHPTLPRGTTVREAARLQSFDDDYKFFGNLTRKAKWVTQDDQVGNAVPPLLAKSIAEHISQVL
jgi:DNA (cytosine-5)-methyltransferase 1